MFVFVSSLYLSFLGSGIVGWLVLELTRDSLCLCITFVFVFVFFRIGYCRLEEERCQRWNPIAELTGDSHLAGRATQISNFWISTKDPGVTSKILGSITASNNWCLSQSSPHVPRADTLLMLVKWTHAIHSTNTHSPFYGRISKRGFLSPTFHTKSWLVTTKSKSKPPCKCWKFREGCFAILTT